MSMRRWLETDLTELSELVGEMDEREAAGLCKLIRGAKRVFVAGQGRSGLVMRMFAMRLMQLGLRAFVAGDAVTPSISKGDLLVIGSGSGETPSVVSAARKAREIGAKIVALTANRDSSVGRLADRVVFVVGGTPKVKAGKATRMPLGSTLEQALLVLLDCVVAELAEQMEQTDESMMKRHANLE